MQLQLSAGSLRQSSGQFRQFLADLQTALNEVALESNPLGTESTSPSEAAEQATEYPTIIDALAPTSTPTTRCSSPRAGSRWVKRAVLLLALSAVIASIQWGLPVLYTSLPHATARKPELVIQLDALQPSSRGDQVPEEIAPIEVTIAPAQAPNLPSVVDDVEALADRGDQFLKQGDIIAARSFYERAAGSGSARAATGVARTLTRHSSRGWGRWVLGAIPNALRFGIGRLTRLRPGKRGPHLTALHSTQRSDDCSPTSRAPRRRRYPRSRSISAPLRSGRSERADRLWTGRNSVIRPCPLFRDLRTLFPNTALLGSSGSASRGLLIGERRGTSRRD